jgi:hypothetical protein
VTAPRQCQYRGLRLHEKFRRAVGWTRRARVARVMPRAGPERRLQKKPVDGGANGACFPYVLCAPKARNAARSQAVKCRKPSVSADFPSAATFL